MYILGLNIGHNATACLLKEGKIIGCVSEERFTRQKNYTGIPFNSINYLLSDNKISINDMNYIVLADDPIYKKSTFAKNFLDAYTKKSFYKKILSKIGYDYPKLYNFYKLFFNKERREKDRKFVKSELSKLLKFPKDKIIIINHHLAHSYSTCFNIPKNKKTLIFTLDGEGSGLCATIGIFDGKNLEIISKSKKDASIGYFYAIVTIFLGMKPLEHEFKVMGLAPYAKSPNIDKIYNQFKELFWIDKNLRFNSKFNMIFAYHFLNEKMRFIRFDTIAGAIQRLTEELTCEWIQKTIQKTGINNIALSGGVFMNVKANQKILELSEVQNLFVMPSCGDEANAIGSCFYGYMIYCKENNIKFDLQPIKDLYLGPEYNNEYVKNLIKEKNLIKRYKIDKIKNINLEAAKLLAKGEIVARCSGRSEWGARALGNRSILANPLHPDTIRILNETIKDRDFWMPFTPSIIEEDINKYIINPKKIESPYMVITFNGTELAKKHLPAAMHPYDFTIRPQTVYQNWNPDYYDLLNNFKKLTGSGAILNTSFNLHGEPNVLTPEDALHTVENSSLKYLILGDYLFKKI